MAPEANSTIIRGEATDKVCLDYATFMLLDNYQKDPGLLQPETAAGMREIDAKWDRVTTANIGVQKPSGFYATLYTPKDGNDCPPTLALRGTVFDDARGIAIAVRQKVYPAVLPGASKEIAYGFAPGYVDPAAGEEGTRWFHKLGYVDELTARGDWIELFGYLGLNTQITSRRSIPLPTVLPASLVTQGDYFDIVQEVTYELWLNRDEGDWATNVLQGVGVETLQYGDDLRKALSDAMKVAREFDNQLRITGHSLGGGLASAAAIRAKALAPDMKIYGLTYDSSGVHPRTAELLEASLDLASDAKILARAVEDEILTSLEKDSDFVPIFSSLLRFTGHKMPPPIGTFVPKKGVSPGPIGNSWVDGKGIVKGQQYAPKWQEMPNLLAISEQELISWEGGINPLKTWDNLASHFAQAATVGQMIENLQREIEDRVQAKRETRGERRAQEEAEEQADEAADAARREEMRRERAERMATEEEEEARAEAEAEAAEAAAEANEPQGILGYFYNRYYDDPRDGLRQIGRGAVEVGDAVGDVATVVTEEAGELGRNVGDEIGDGADQTMNTAGDALNAAYEATLEHMVEYGLYGTELAAEVRDFAKLFGAIAAYHDAELAAFTFAIDESA